MRLNHTSSRALPVLYNYSFSFWDRVTLFMYLHFQWFRDSALVVQILHAQFPPALVMSWSVVIVNLNRCGVSVKKSFCIYQSTIWLGRNSILVVLWTIIFLSKVKLCKSCLKTCKLCDWEWLQNFFHLLSHLLRLEKGCSGSFFFPLTLKTLRVSSIKFLLVIAMLCKTEWFWELQIWSHKMNLLDILSTSPHCLLLY